MGICENMAGFFVVRLFLGITESGLFPGVVYYFSMWYKRRERQYRIALFFSAASLAGAFGGILAYVSSHRFYGVLRLHAANFAPFRESAS